MEKELTFKYCYSSWRHLSLPQAYWTNYQLQQKETLHKVLLSASKELCTEHFVSACFYLLCPNPNEKVRAKI